MLTPPPPSSRQQAAPASVAAASGPILIQGERYSFHDRARELLLPDCASEPVRSFDALTARVARGDGARGLMAIENSIAGALLPNYLLLERHDLRIVAEVYLRISHALLARPGTTAADVRTVLSHPMALRQCTRVFAQHPHWRRLEGHDTAGAAAALTLPDSAHDAAIAPRWCAEAFGLEVLAAGIEDNPHNWTRFVLVERAAEALMHSGTKTSIAFSLRHEAGSLLRALEVLAPHPGAPGDTPSPAQPSRYSMTKIQSLPQVGKPWHYRFFVDFEHDREAQPSDLLTRLAAEVTDLRHLGTYAHGQHHTP